MAARPLQAANGWLTILWCLIVIPALLWWRDSVPFLVFVSIYANIAGHLAAWQAARSEVKQEESDA